MDIPTIFYFRNEFNSILHRSTDALQRKLEIIKRMQPRHIDDFVPLLDMREPILRDVAKTAATEYNVIPDRSRIYYLSKELQVTCRSISHKAKE